MMRPDELRTKVAALDSLELAMSKLRKAEAICSAYIFYDGHQAKNTDKEESIVVRTALVDHHRSIALISANELRCSGIDPSSLLNGVAIA